VSTLGTEPGASRDPPEQARLRQLADEQAALRRVATLAARGVPPEQVFAAVTREAGRALSAGEARLRGAVIIEGRVFRRRWPTRPSTRARPPVAALAACRGELRRAHAR
jgi:hypothetical protein